MAYEDDDPLGQEYLGEIITAEKEVEESFESLQRALDSHAALNVLLESRFLLPDASFEAAVKPVVLAVYAGTGVNPALTDYSTESVAELVKRSLLAVAKAIREFFTKFVEYLTTVDLSAVWLTRKLGAIERKVSASRGKTVKDKHIVVGRMGRYLRVDRAYADDSIKLESALNDLKDIVRLAGHDLTNALASAADEIPDKARGKTGSALDDALTHLVLQIPFDALAQKFRMSGTSRFGRSNIMASRPLLNGKSVFFMRAKLAEKGTKAFRFHGFVFDNTNDNPGAPDDKRKFKAMAPEELGSIPGTTRDLLLAVSKSTGTNVRQRISRTRTHMENFVKHAAEDKNLTASDIEIIKRTTSAFIYWLHSVLRPLNISTVSVCRGVIAYCEASIKTYTTN